METIYIVCFGRYHLWDLAKEFSKLNLNVVFITSYPKSKLNNFNDGKLKVVNILYLEYFRIAGHRYITNSYFLRWFTYFISILFQFGASFYIKSNSKVIVLAENLFFLNKIKPNAFYYLDRGSTHISFHIEVMKNLYKSKSISKDIDIPKYILNSYLHEYNLAKKILVPSQFVFDSFISNDISEKKLEICPYGVDLDVFKPNWNNDKKEFTVLFVGTFSIRKGFLDLIDIINSPLLDNIKFLLVGDFTSETREYENFLKNRDNVTIITWVSQNTLTKYYSASDLFILPSYEEGMAMVQIQALAMGLPLLVTTNSGADQIFKISNVGYRIVPGQIDEFVKKILLIQNNLELRNSFSRNNIHVAQNNFTWYNYAVSVLNVLNNNSC